MDYNSLMEKLKGPVFPIVTPFTDDFKVDYPAVTEYVDYLYSGGARIFHIMVHTSRFSLLLADEQMELNRIVCSHIKKHYNDAIAIAAGPMFGPTSLSIEYARKAKEAGADLIGLYFAERYYNEEQLYGFFADVASTTDIGILVHEQQITTINFSKLMLFPDKVLNRLADIDNIIAIKEDSYEPQYTARLVGLLKDRMSVIVSGGSKQQFLDFAPLGSQAYLVGIGSVFPDLAVSFYQAHTEGRIDDCRKIITNFEEPFFKVTKRLGWHIALKAAMESVGIMSSQERPPLCCLDHSEYDEVKKVTLELKSLINT